MPEVSDSVALVCVASRSYLHYAEALMESAREYFRPTGKSSLIFEILEGEEGWPIGTECRHRIFHAWLLEQRCQYALLLDADMLFVRPVAHAEMFSRYEGITATLHPGYVWFDPAILPYERRPESRAYVVSGEGKNYYCGGVIGGSRREILRLSFAVAEMIEREREDGREVCWHDESCVNTLLIDQPPMKTLDPRFCCPSESSYYRQHVWGDDYSADARILALDKTAAERGDR